MTADASDQPVRDTTPLRPRPLTPFVGRSEDVVAVVALCLRHDVHLVTITGPGGMGKTRLAIEVATQGADAFDDGVVFVSLAALRDPDLVPVTVAQALGVPTTAGPSLAERIESSLQHKRLLLVLDNLEHLPGTNPFIADLLAAHPALTILCTSRSRLTLSGEHIVSLAPLALDDAVELFAQRAGAQDPRFAMTASDIPVVRAICARLDHLPLAIELAAARTLVLPLDDLLARLDQRLPLLTGGPHDAPDRQHTMRDAIAWSYDLLPADARRAFRRLCVCVGGFTLEAAGAIAADEDDALDVVTSLVASSLVVRTRSASGGLRFTMLETIREFGLDHLIALGEHAAAAQAHADFCISLTEGAIPHYDGPDSTTFANRVQSEFDNIRAALAWCLSVPDAQRAVRLAGAIWRNWWARVPPGSEAWHEGLAEGTVWLERALALREGLPVEHVAEALMGAGEFAAFQGDPERARAYGRELLERSNAEGYGYGVYWAHLVFGNAAQTNGDLVQAIDCYKAALAIAPTIRDPENHAAVALMTLGEIAIGQGDYARAKPWLIEAAASVRVCGNAWVATYIHHLLGHLYRHQGEYARGASALAECLDCLSKAGDIGQTEVALMELAQLAVDIARPATAIQFLAAATRVPGAYWPEGELERAVAPLRASVREPDFSREWAAGEQLSWEDLVALARSLGTNESSGGETSLVHGLSRREVDVLRLLVDGASNRMIGDALSISERTVESHVQHILAKLQLESRTAAATFAVRQGLV